MSKNNPSNRAKKGSYGEYKGKPVRPAKFVSEEGVVMIAQYADGNVVLDDNGNVVLWNAII